MATRMKAKGLVCSVPGCEKPMVAVGQCDSHRRRTRRHGDPLGGRTPVGRHLRWLTELIASGDRSVCWEWPGGQSRGGYGCVTYQGRTTKAHHVALILDGRPRPDGLFGLHSCDNPPCVNPAHLRWGTAAENTADALRRNRLTIDPELFSPLSSDDVLEIVQLRSRGLSHQAIANLFNVHRMTVSRIIAGETWSSVTGIAR